MLARTLSRPRWAIPTTISSAPVAAAVSMNCVESRNQRLRPFEREPLLPLIAALGKALEELRIDQLTEDAVFLLTAEFRPVADRLHLGLQPPPGLHVLEVEVLDGGRTAIGIPEHAEDLPQRGLLCPSEVAGVEDLVEVPLAQTEGLELEERMALEVVAERVEVRDQVADVAIGEDEARHSRLIRGSLGGDGPRRAVGEVEPGEEQPPLLSHGARIELPLFVHLFDVLRACQQRDAFRCGS